MKRHKVILFVGGGCIAALVSAAMAQALKGNPDVVYTIEDEELPTIERPPFLIEPLDAFEDTYIDLGEPVEFKPIEPPKPIDAFRFDRPKRKPGYI